eukprot:g558.t1
MVFLKTNLGRPWTRETFEGLLDELYWVRCAVAPCFGLAFGAAPLEGAAGLAAFVVLSTVIVFVYMRARYVLDEDSYGGITGLLQEGGMPSFALFMLTWIITYTAMHAADEDEYIYID